MPFDPEELAAMAIIGVLHFDDMPARAQDALEAGFDGPGVLRLAILDHPSAWEIEPLLPKVFAELEIVVPNA